MLASQRVRVNPIHITHPFRPTTCSRQFHITPHTQIQVGDPVPDVLLMESSPGNKVSLAKQFKGCGKGLIIGIPAAFSPSCSASHIPGYIKSSRLNSVGQVFVVSVNDPFVMKAFGTSLDPEGASGIRFLADTHAEFTNALNLSFNAPAIFGQPRSKRYALVIEDGRIKQMFVEPDNTGLKESRAENVIEAGIKESRESEEISNDVKSHMFRRARAQAGVGSPICSAVQIVHTRKTFSTSVGPLINDRQTKENLLRSVAFQRATMARRIPFTSFPSRYIEPRPEKWPYSDNDFRRTDESPDDTFYATPRLVTHIDEGAITALRSYYSQNLPLRGRIVDLCSSWISHYPPDHENAVRVGDLTLVGVGMNAYELEKNPLLHMNGSRIVQDLNVQPRLSQDATQEGHFDAVTCVVSIDYLTSPVEVLLSALQATSVGGMCHLVISNRCFPTKAIKRWLRVDEEERLRMVGHYLQFAGWKEVEVVDLIEIGGWGDPLWVVRGIKR